MPPKYVRPNQWFNSPNYLYGADLYNHAYWWEAHEAWEGLWQLTDKSGSQGYFLQGIIQVAACHLKLYVGHYDGVERLFSSSLAYLNRVAHQDGNTLYMGLNLVEFITAVQDYYGGPDAAANTRVEHDPARFPYFTLAPKPG